MVKSDDVWQLCEPDLVAQHRGGLQFLAAGETLEASLVISPPSSEAELVSVCDVRMQMRRKEGSNTSESKRDLRPDSTSGNDLGSKGGRGGRLVGLRRGLRQAV